MSREVYQVFPAPTLQLIRRHLSLSEAPLSLRLRFSFSLMRFWNLSHAVCCLSACHRSFAHRQIWGVCVFCQAVDYSRPRDWCSLFNMFTCKTRFVAAAAACCFSPSTFSRDRWIKYWKVGLFQSSKHTEEEYLNSKVPPEIAVFGTVKRQFLWACSKWSCEWFKSQGRTLLRCHISPTLLFITRE